MRIAFLQLELRDLFRRGRNYRQITAASIDERVDGVISLQHRDDRVAGYGKQNGVTCPRTAVALVSAFQQALAHSWLGSLPFGWSPICPSVENGEGVAKKKRAHQVGRRHGASARASVDDDIFPRRRRRRRGGARGRYFWLGFRFGRLPWEDCRVFGSQGRK